MREGRDGSHRPRPRKPSLAERRAERAGIDDPAVVLEAAARFLEARPRSEAEVRRRLTTAGYRAELVDTALTRLAELGYLDDAEFARAWVASRDRARPRGEHALRRELTLKGVDRATVDAALEDRRDAADASPDAAPGGDDPDEAAAERLLARRLPALLREPDPRRRLQKAYALLARNGFAPDVCSAVARRMTGEAHPSA